MASLRRHIDVEIDNIHKILDKFPSAQSLPNLSELELAGVAALVHSFYNGIENILKQIIYSRGLKVSSGPTWHRDLVELAIVEKIISESTAERLRQYLAFRHFFSHAYAFEIHADRIVSLVDCAREVFQKLLDDIK